MPRPRNGYHNLTTQIPEAHWLALSGDAKTRRLSVADLLTRLIGKAYRIPSENVPPKNPGGRPRKEV